jgi:hypothetical protein
MGIVNRYARGLLSLLDSQTQGDTPSSMSDVIAPTMDLSELMFAAKGLEVTVVTETAAPSSLGLFAVNRVPAGEMWVVRRVVAQITDNDGVNVIGTLRFVPVVVSSATQYPRNLMSGWMPLGVSLQINSSMSQPAPLPYPLTLNENAYCAVRIETVAAYAGVDPTFTCAVEYHKLQV